MKVGGFPIAIVGAERGAVFTNEAYVKADQLHKTGPLCGSVIFERTVAIGGHPAHSGVKNAWLTTAHASVAAAK